MSSRIQKHTLLENPVRSTIDEIIRQRPGIAFVELFESLKSIPEFSHRTGFGSLCFHLNAMIRLGHLTTRKSGRHRRYYLNGAAYGGQTTALSVLQSVPALRITEFIRRAPGENQKTLWAMLNEVRPCSRQALGFQLRRLEEHGLVLRIRTGPFHYYFPTELLDRLAQIAAGLSLGDAAARSPSGFGMESGAQFGQGPGESGDGPTHTG